MKRLGLGRGMKGRILLGAAFLAGCASHTKDIKPQYVSPVMFQNLTCDQLAAEGARLRSAVSSLGGEVDKQASRDSTQMAVGLVLLWPTLFWLDGDTPQAQEYARLSGEYRALEQAMNTRCTPATSPTAASVPAS